jgi:hypothetical protein
VAYSRIARYIKKLVPNQAFKGTIFVIIEKGLKKPNENPGIQLEKSTILSEKLFYDYIFTVQFEDLGQ